MPSREGEAAIHIPNNIDSFLHTVSRATSKTHHAAWTDAVSLWEQVVAINPLVGGFRVQLADAAYHAHDYPRAITAYERALKLGLVGYRQPMDLGKGFPFDVAYRIACCDALSGDQEQALEWLADAMKRGYRTLAHAQQDPDLHALRDDVRFRQLVELVDRSTLSREEGWCADLDLFAHEVKRKGYGPFRFVTEDEFDAAVRTLRDAIPTYHDVQMFVEFQKLIRLIGSPVNRRGALFVIIGRRTFSAAQNAATMIEQHTNAIFVGEPTGSSPNSIGEESPIQLPFSKIWLNVSDLFWQTSWPTESRTWIAPLIWTPPTFAAYLENRDMALEAILHHLEYLPGW